MISLSLAVYCLLSPLGFVALVSFSGMVGRRLSFGEFSWSRYGAWLGVAVALTVLVIAARSGGLFFGLAALLVFWVLVRAAADAQATTLLEKLGFLQLYAGLCLVQLLTVSRVGALDGTRASPWLTYVLHDTLGHLVLPVASLMGGAAAADVVAGIGQSLAGSWMFAGALATFGIAAFVYAHFAEHATPKIGLSLLPAPTVVAAVFVAAWGTALATPGTAAGAVARAAGVVLAPFFVAEGLWVIHRLARRLATRGMWTPALALLCVFVPRVAVVLATLGLGFHLVRLRSFQPILGDVLRSAARPRLRTALGVAGSAAALSLLLGAGEAAALRRASPALLAPPSVCAEVTFLPVVDGTSTVSITGPLGTFRIDADETPLSSGADAEQTCALRGARLCTSDEWALACRCSFPNESQGGVQLTSNPRMLFRRENERAHPVGPGASDVRGLLTGATERVAGGQPGPTVLLAGSSDAVDAPIMVDCRYRSLLTQRALRDNAFPFVAARCCR